MTRFIGTLSLFLLLLLQNTVGGVALKLGMNNQQLYLAIGIPALIAIFNTGVIVTLLLHFTSKMDARMDRLENRIDAKLDLIQRDLREFYATQKQHDTRLEMLEGKGK